MSTSIGYIRCHVCGDLSNGHLLCEFHRDEVKAHLEGDHDHALSSECPECLIYVP